LGLYKSTEKENVEIERRGTKKDRRQMKWPSSPAQ